MKQFQLPKTGLFWDKVNTDGDCWIWSGAKGDNGYGHFSRMGKTIAAHRFVYEQTIGPIQIGLMVCHRCDNRLCVRPAHLFLGTHQDNSSDMQRKGRASRGQDRPNAKLTENDVLEIRRLSDTKITTYAALAERFGVSIAAIRDIVTRRNWRHL